MDKLRDSIGLFAFFGFAFFLWRWHKSHVFPALKGRSLDRVLEWLQFLAMVLAYLAILFLFLLVYLSAIGYTVLDKIQFHELIDGGLLVGLFWAASIVVYGTRRFFGRFKFSVRREAS